MKNLVANFSKQVKEALEIGEKSKLTPAKETILSVLVTGLGGSGIGGSIVAELTAMECTVPVTVSKGYFIPAWVNKNTLVIVSSYSGNTEETINAMNLAIECGAKIVCVTSGGKILDTAKQKEFDFIQIPGGMPPRSCLGYSLVQQFFVLNFFGLIGNGFKVQLKAAIELIDKEEENIKAEAKQLAEKLVNTIPVIYATTYYEGVAIRFRQQINENSKMLCWHHVIPEMNHNELVGWREKYDNFSVVLFRDKNDFERNQTRIEINKEVFKKYTANIFEIYSKGNSDIEKSIYLIHLGDWISVYIADIKNIDATEVKVIDFLKGELAKK